MSLHKILLLLPLVGLVSCASNPIGSAPAGQNFEAGTIRVGGDLGYSSNGTGTMNGDAVHLDGNAGYFVTNQIEVGGAFNIEDVNVKGGSDLEAVSFGVYGRAYNSATGPYRTFAELGLAVGTVEAGSTEADLTALSIAVGMLQFISDDVAVELALEQSFYGFDAPAVDGNGLALNVGVSWYL
ncbi:MAG: hypothetical protein GY747_07320 [Planctomycetes bacterium]|nr:hypothetical protein [Planctomycetota bacterium]MCP4771870.1 hypothetical protein [Planctomycetota bacterium]MCP4861894.1 hypothetical protein [Planctomycetota bacterium]